MGRSVVEVDVLGSRYELTQLGAIKGRKILAVLTRVLGKAAGGIGSEDSGLGALLESIDEAALTALCDAFGESSRVLLDNGNKPQLTGVIFDDHFAGNYAGLLLWLAECLRLNFSDFLDESKREQIARQLGLKTLKSSSPKASTGTPGES
jgi:hypothetical protein